MALIYIYTPCDTGISFSSNMDSGGVYVGKIVSFPNLQPGNCFTVTVEEVTLPVAGYINIDWNTQPINSYDVCEQCQAALLTACYCSAGKNVHPNQPLQVRYVDCLGQIQAYPSSTTWLAPGETGPKVCLRQWNFNENLQTFFYGDCVDNACVEPTYRLYSCDGTIVPICSTNPDLEDYVGSFVKLNEISTTCFYVEVIPANQCTNPLPVTVALVQDCTNCTLNCYEIDKGLITYVDLEGNLIQIYAPAKICSLIYPVVSSDLKYTITENGPCTEEGECPSVCYELVDCKGELPNIISSSPSLDAHYTANEIVVITGYDTCWTINTTVDCDCAIDVVVERYYSSCQECLGNTYYKLTECTTGAIKYTNVDLSTYVNQVVELLDCEGCWLVELIDYTPPSLTTVTVTYSFENCDKCKQSYWLLEDCNGIEADIITITDLSVYENEVIRLTWCPEICWTVTSTRLHTNVSIVFVEEEYTTCQECLIDILPCVCSAVRNTEDTARSYDYIDCNGETQTSELIAPGLLSVKRCAKQWLNAKEVIEYGDCINNECPQPEYPKYIVIPGYDTPTCDKDKYEMITCSASEALYKRVLQKRYGIANCCPDEDYKWLLKKEIIDLDAIRNPDYECSPVTDCCNRPISSCSCNS